MSQARCYYCGTTLGFVDVKIEPINKLKVDHSVHFKCNHCGATAEFRKMRDRSEIDERVLEVENGEAT